MRYPVCPQCNAESLSDFHMLWGSTATSGRLKAKAQLACKRCGKIFTWKSESSHAGGVLLQIHANEHSRRSSLESAA